MSCLTGQQAVFVNHTSYKESSLLLIGAYWSESEVKADNGHLGFKN